MKQWTLCSADAGGETGERFGDLDRVFALDGEAIAAGPLSDVVRVEIDGRRYFVKRYTRPGKNALRRWIGTPRVEAEWRNLQRFEAWGIPTARLVAWGHERRLRAFVRGALITEEIPHTVDLERIARGDPVRFRDRQWFRHVSRQIAHIVATLHRHGFTHNDLHWRNLLFQETTGTVYLIDCPNGAFWFGPPLRYRIAKDLACLDKFARIYLSRSQRLRFYLDYAGRERLDERDKAAIRDALAAHQRRLRRKGLLA